MKTEYICKHIVRMIQTQVRVYNEDNNLLSIYGQIENQNDILNDNLKNKLLSNIKEYYPAIYSEEYGIKYACFISKENNKFIIGPICTDKNVKESEKYIAKSLNLKDDSVKISYCSFHDFCEEILLLYNLLNDGDITYDELIIKNFMNDRLLQEIEKEVFNVQFKYQKNGELHNPYDRELRIIDSIKNGDSIKLKRSLDEVFVGKYGTMARESLRSAKNVAICHICLASRAAISGGILPEIAFSICDSFSIKVEDCNRIAEVESIERESQFYFADIVNKQKNRITNLNYNTIIEQCKNIIFKNMHKKIFIKEIAKELCVNEDYLSRIFHKNEGIKIHDYIQKEKILLSENLLIYSDYTFGEIAQFLAFCSQSHFIETFKKWRGITPQRFKNKYAIKNIIYSSNN